MSFFDQYTSMISKLIINGEELFNLCELASCIEMDKTPQTTTPLQATGHVTLAAFAKYPCKHGYLAHCSRESIDSCIIMPFYVCKGSRYELYQYEFYIESQNGESFQEYILRVTGRENIEKVPTDILEIRQKCFVKLEEGNQSDVLMKMKNYFIFLMKDEKIRKEIMDVFSEFDINKLFVCIY